MRECGSGTRAEGSEVERVDKMWSGRWPGLEKGEGRVWGHHDTRVVGAERQIKKRKYKCGEIVREPREPAGLRPQGSADLQLWDGGGGCLPQTPCVFSRPSMVLTTVRHSREFHDVSSLLSHFFIICSMFHNLPSSFSSIHDLP